MEFRYKKLVSVLCGVFSLGGYAQTKGTLSFYNKIENQYSAERVFSESFFTNKARMTVYSDLSFSELGVNYQQDKKDAYVLQDGDGLEGFKVSTNSFQRLKGNKVVWGSASYMNQRQQNMVWNESLDKDIIGPYVVADSVGGTMKQEVYQFAGGFAKQWNRWVLGGEVNYVAKNGYRQVDPRSKNTSSIFKMDLGIDYNFYRDYEIGVFGHFNKYTQNSSVKFVSEISKPYVYHMSGLGSYNYFFSGAKDLVSTFEGFGYNVGATLAKSKNKSFVLQGVIGKFNLTKNKGDSGVDAYDLAKLETTTYTVSGLKFFDFGQHRVGMKMNYWLKEAIGTEYFYTQNAKIITRLAEKELYKYIESNFFSELFYQYKDEVNRLVAIPFFGVEQNSERRKDTFAKQRFTYIHFGLTIDYMRQISKSGVLNVKPYVKVRNVKESTNKLMDFPSQKGVTEMLYSNFEVMNANYKQIGLVARYDLQLEKVPAFYVQAQVEQTKYNINKSNNYMGVAVGVTF